MVSPRYYTPLYHLDPDREKREDLLILCHSNKICLVALAPSHPIVKDNLVIDKVNLDVSKNIDRKSNKTSGKSKKGGQALEHSSILAIIETDSGSFPVKVFSIFLRRITFSSLYFLAGCCSWEADLHQ